MSPYEQIAIRIIKEQEFIVGPLAWSEAAKVKTLVIDKDHKAASIRESEKETINDLVARFGKLFGKISQAVCREAAAPIIASLKPDEIPSSLI